MRALYGWCGDCGKSLRLCEGHGDAARNAVTVEADLIAEREALELEAEEREARDWRAGVERPEV